MDARHDAHHIRETGLRWASRRHRRQEDPDYREEWRTQQCGACEFWVPFAGKLGLDYGGCTNVESPLEGTILNEHDGCDEFSRGQDWGTPDAFT